MKTETSTEAKTETLNLEDLSRETLLNLVLLSCRFQKPVDQIITEALLDAAKQPQNNYGND